MTNETPDTSFVPQLDARQRAMLAEMGVRVWAPRPVTPAPPAAISEQPAPDMPVPATAVPPARPPVVAPAPVAATMAPTPATATTRPLAAGLDWPELREAVAGCQACGLCKSRRNTVFGVGDVQADWMIVGEAPGENEDRQGEPFVGAAGQLLDNMLRAVGRSRQGEGAQGTYIANVLKCRPPANRNPQPEEVARCEPYLVRQVALVKPRVIVAMGRFAVQSLLKTTEPIGRLRGRVHRYEGVPVIVTYHPAYLLRTPGDKGKAWADLCLAMETVEQS
ncbi:uracil-DNA glycosylase [Hydrogenophaga laconesensis]|uniref:Type-4 uracil-DNA glycosylase n=1 Tax=Hydrogenophaga laconesensis TaxID=1805971 RepID=A0ABU1V7J1_9BURK|nr:uracil-DNA glycosylase [Hydrogenophaga laconesensis]MDR7093397.1 DNA polymerase [Hydrogenophaga laconesensis]